MTKNIKIIRLSWIIVFILLLLCLLWQAIVPLGKISFQTNFQHQSYIFGQLVPTQRVIKVNSGQKIIAEPIYFSIYSPRKFNKAKITIEFVSSSILLNLGLAHNKALWLYDFKTLTNSKPLEFDLSKAERLNNRYTFMLSAPTLIQNQDELIVKNIKVEFFGSTWRAFIDKL